MITPPAKSRNIKSDRDNFIDQTRNRTSAISAFCMMKITARHARMSAKINLKFMELSFRVDQDPNGEFFLFFSCFFFSLSSFFLFFCFWFFSRSFFPLSPILLLLTAQFVYG